MRTTKLTGDGKLEALHAEVLAGPKLTPTGETVTLPCDALILAMGFVGPEAKPIAQQLGVQLDKRGNVAVDRDYRTSHSKVWAAGDAKRGASLIVWAIAEGREAARAIDAELRGQPSWLATRGQDLPFGGR
jgi:glutamate synthase (NADPH/NADH) small chain